MLHNFYAVCAIQAIQALDTLLNNELLLQCNVLFQVNKGNPKNTQ